MLVRPGLAGAVECRQGRDRGAAGPGREGFFFDQEKEKGKDALTPKKRKKPTRWMRTRLQEGRKEKSGDAQV